MFRHSVRRFATTAARRAAAAPVAAHEPSVHTLAVSKAQGVAKGLTGGMFSSRRFLMLYLGPSCRGLGLPCLFSVYAAGMRYDEMR